MEYNIKSPKWMNFEKTSLALTVNGEEIIFSLPSSAEPQQTWIKNAIDGAYGEISEYVAPVYTSDELSAMAREKRNNILRFEIDPLVSNPLRWASFTQEDQTAIATYRQELLDLTLQENFPENIVWPTKPSIMGGIIKTGTV